MLREMITWRGEQFVQVVEWPDATKWWRSLTNPEMHYCPRPEEGYRHTGFHTSRDWESKVAKCITPLYILNLEDKKPARIEMASSQQVGGDHYSKLAIQPMEYSIRNNLDPLQHTIVKYATRHKDKGGAQDIRKLIHTAQLILELQYGEGKKDEVQE